MKIITNNLLPPKKFLAINLFGVLFVRKDKMIKISETVINHEYIHTAQMKELLYIPFYIIYFTEWLIKILFYFDHSYRNLSFEREAFNNQYDLEYLKNRKHYSFLKYLFKDK